MAEDADKESKTEEASEKKIADAIEKGNTPYSREATIFASMLAILVILTLFITTSTADLTTILSRFIDDPAGCRLEAALRPARTGRVPEGAVQVRHDRLRLRADRQGRPGSADRRHVRRSHF